MLKFLNRIFVLSAFFILVTPSIARAEVLTFEMHWSGIRGEVRADGTVTLDVQRISAGLGMPNGMLRATGENVISFNLTVKNAQNGNGVFDRLWVSTTNGREEPGSLNFYTDGNIDLSKELTTQEGFINATESTYGSFNIYGPLGHSFPPISNANGRILVER